MVMPVKGGEVVAIPLTEQLFFFAVVLFASKKWKDVILLGIADKSYKDLSIDLDSIPLNLRSMIYTSSAPIESEEWKVVRQENNLVSESLSKRIDGTSVWVGDKRLRTATDFDRQSLPVMRVAGPNIVQEYARYLLGFEQKNKFFRKLESEMRVLMEENAM